MLRSQSRQPAHALDMRTGGRNSSRFFNDRGDLNAGSRVDAIHQIGAMLQEVANGTMSFEPHDSDIETAAVKKALNDNLIAAYRDRSNSGAWAEIGSTIGLDVTETAARAGMARRLLARADLSQGNTPRIRVRTRDVRAYSTTGVGSVAPVYQRDRYIYPPEYNIVANVRVLEEEIQTGAADLLDEVFLRAQEAIQVREDLDYMASIRALTGAVNPLTLLVGGLTPSNLATLRTQVAQWNLSPVNLVIGSGIWSDIMGNANGFSNLFDPVTQYELYREGRLGTLLGLNIITDGYRSDSQRVMLPNEVLITAKPTEHGGFSDRGAVVAVPVDSYPDGIIARGWMMHERVSQSISNLRSFALGRRA